MTYHVERLDSTKHVNDICLLATEHNAEFGFDRPFSVDAIKSNCKFYTSEHNQRFVAAWIVYVDDDVPIGYIIAKRSELFHSWECIVTQEMFFVVAPYRGTRAFLLLLNEMTDWANQHNAHKIYLTVAHDEPTDKTKAISSLYEKLGYKMQGTYHVKEISHDSQ